MQSMLSAIYNIFQESKNQFLKNIVNGIRHTSHFHPSYIVLSYNATYRRHNELDFRSPEKYFEWHLAYFAFPSFKIYCVRHTYSSVHSKVQHTPTKYIAWFMKHLYDATNQ